MVYFGTLICPFSTKSLLCLHGCFSKISKNSVSRGHPVLRYTTSLPLPPGSNGPAYLWPMTVKVIIVTFYLISCEGFLSRIFYATSCFGFLCNIFSDFLHKYHINYFYNHEPQVNRAIGTRGQGTGGCVTLFQIKMG